MRGDLSCWVFQRHHFAYLVELRGGLNCHGENQVFQNTISLFWCPVRGDLNCHRWDKCFRSIILLFWSQMRGGLNWHVFQKHHFTFLVADEERSQLPLLLLIAGASVSEASFCFFGGRWGENSAAECFRSITLLIWWSLSGGAEGRSALIKLGCVSLSFSVICAGGETSYIGSTEKW